jgi:hypothetical protein
LGDRRGSTDGAVFREPAADGYRNASDFGPADRITALIAPEAFALSLDELELS